MGHPCIDAHGLCHAFSLYNIPSDTINALLTMQLKTCLYAIQGPEQLYMSLTATSVL